MRLRTAMVTMGLMACASVASADVKLVAQMTGKMMGMNPSGETVTYIKGNKMRTDQTMGGNQMSTIMDVDSGEMITLNHKKKEADVWSIADMGQLLQDAGASPSGVNVTMTPNGQTKEIAGYSATGHDMAVSVESAMQGAPMKMTVTISGPAFLSTAAPGAKDYANFYLAAADKGFFFGDPRAAKAQPGNARGMMALYKSMAEKGVPLESTTTIKLSGDGPMAGLFARMGGGQINTTVTSVSADTLAADLFVVPADYKVKRQKID
ncbi:MAG: DUF4412 domain-containing protein [Luteitalea sp.]